MQGKNLEYFIMNHLQITQSWKYYKTINVLIIIIISSAIFLSGNRFFEQKDKHKVRKFFSLGEQDTFSVAFN